MVLDKVKGCIYYSDNRLDPIILEACQKQLLKAFKGDIVSVTLKPMDFGKNIVVDLPRGYPTMVKQIVTALENLETETVFFTEHDVLYHPSHFEFTPQRADMFYYNSNVWRWQYPLDRIITYDTLKSLSGLCCNRELALRHYTSRMNKMVEKGWDLNYEGESINARLWGYEPGTKPTKKGGFSDEEHRTWKSKFPIVDIRHGKTFTRSKTTKEEFKHIPAEDTWKETTLDRIEGWNLKELFK